ncbi:MAG TPA: hypothetical protein VHO50_07770 [Bacteroidales bacterium]|nr:hypothetical protein [Bacteroidales bacterium]
MENKKSIVPLILVVIVSAFLIYYAVMLSMAPGKKMADLQAAFAPVPPEKGDYNEKLFQDSAYISLLKIKSFLASRTALADQDSIYLLINLADSIANLEISGVPVHSAKISSYEISKILEEGDRNIIYTMLTTPLTIEDYISTIDKEPVKVKIAPKDTSEYIPDATPDTSIIEQVNYMFEVSNGIRIYINQEENQTSDDKRSVTAFNTKERIKDTWVALKSVANLKTPEYHPSIKIRIPRNDAKVIFRALPRNGQIVVKT